VGDGLAGLGERVARGCVADGAGDRETLAAGVGVPSGVEVGPGGTELAGIGRTTR
jgi:hypothetical protein